MSCERVSNNGHNGLTRLLMNSRLDAFASMTIEKNLAPKSSLHLEPSLFPRFVCKGLVVRFLFFKAALGRWFLFFVSGSSSKL